MAERGGFEPPIRLLAVYRFSKPAPSATRPSLQTSRKRDRPNYTNGAASRQGEISEPLRNERILTLSPVLKVPPLPGPFLQFHWRRGKTEIWVVRGSVNIVRLMALILTFSRRTGEGTAIGCQRLFANGSCVILGPVFRILGAVSGWAFYKRTRLHGRHSAVAGSAQTTKRQEGERKLIGTDAVSWRRFRRQF